MAKENRFYQKGFRTQFKTELKFMSTTNTHDWENLPSIRLMSRHHKRLVDFNIRAYRNKYASDRWISDSRGCGWGCIVSKRRFEY